VHGLSDAIWSYVNDRAGDEFTGWDAFSNSTAGDTDDQYRGNPWNPQVVIRALRVTDRRICMLICYFGATAEARNYADTQ